MLVEKGSSGKIILKFFCGFRRYILSNFIRRNTVLVEFG